MSEVERGAVAYEIGEVRGNQRFLLDDAETAAALLSAQSKHSPEVLGRRWKTLKSAEQDALGEELLEIPRFGVVTAGAVANANLSPQSASYVLSAVEAYHDALPFTKAERLWLTDMRHRAIDNWHAREVGLSAIHWVMTQRQEVVNLGRRQTVNGEELISREWDWIRSGGDYRSGSTYEDARIALQGFVRLFEFDADSLTAMQLHR